MLDVALDEVLEAQGLGAAMINDHGVDGETGFQHRVLVKVVNDHLGQGVPLDFDDDARVLVRFVAHGGDVRQHFFVDKLGDALDQQGAVDIVGNGGDDNVFAPALDFLQADLAADFDRAASGLEVLLDAGQAADGAAGGEIRPLDVLHQLLHGNVRVVNLGADAIHDFAQIVRGHVGGHAHGDASAAVDQEVGKGGGENGRLGQALVVIGDKINGVLLHVLHQGGAQMGHARLGVAPTVGPCGPASGK